MVHHAMTSCDDDDDVTATPACSTHLLKELLCVGCPSQGEQGNNVLLDRPEVEAGQLLTVSPTLTQLRLN